MWSYNGRMNIVNFPGGHNSRVGAGGVCPHCSVMAFHSPVPGAHVETQGDIDVICQPVQCEPCKGFGLVIGHRPGGSGNNIPWEFREYYPPGKPDDSVDKAAPKDIAADFSEALRCRYIKAYRATAVMCRRSLRASTVEQGGVGRRLIEQIASLSEQGKITVALKDMAYTVRTIGNDGIHPGKDGLDDVAEVDADDVIEFTRQFFAHVYVMPAKLEAMKQRRNWKRLKQ